MHKVALQAVALQVVGQRGQYHSLVVGIVGLHRYVVLIVIALKEAILVIHLQVAQQLHVVIHRPVVYANGQQRAVGRYHYPVGGGVLEFQVGDAEGMILVVLGIIQLVVGGLRDAPRQLLVAPLICRLVAPLFHKGPLGADGETVGLVHQCVAVGGQEDEGHKVFEHRPVPRGHTLVSAILHQRLVQAEPVLIGGVALRYGEE